MLTLETRSLKIERGNEKLLGEDVDRGLLLQSSKDRRIWVEGLEDLVNLGFELF